MGGGVWVAGRVQELSALGLADSSLRGDHLPPPPGQPQDLQVARVGAEFAQEDLFTDFSPLGSLSCCPLGPSDLGAHPLGLNAPVPRPPGVRIVDSPLHKGR